MELFGFYLSSEFQHAQDGEQTWIVLLCWWMRRWQRYLARNCSDCYQLHCMSILERWCQWKMNVSDRSREMALRSSCTWKWIILQRNSIDDIKWWQLSDFTVKMKLVVHFRRLRDRRWMAITWKEVGIGSSVAVRSIFVLPKHYVFTYSYENEYYRLHLSNLSPLQMKNSKKVLAWTRVPALFSCGKYLFIAFRMQKIQLKYTLWGRAIGEPIIAQQKRFSDSIIW